jgi:DNA-binding transcriptional ArsR family regulator
LDKKQGLSFCAGLGLIALLMSCFIIQIYPQQNHNHPQNLNYYASVPNTTTLNTLPINPYAQTALPSIPTAKISTVNHAILTNSTRNQIFSCINQNPGIQFRAIASALCLPVGLAEYHIGVLTRAGIVSFIRDGRYKRFFISKRFINTDMKLICLLRHKTPKKIFKTLLTKQRLSHSQLAKELAITSQALTWQMKTLKNTHLILSVNEGPRIIYSINQSATLSLEKNLTIVEQHPF